jgi:hypothetical protein
MSEPDDIRDEVEHYRQIVLLYEALDHEIDALLMQYGGASENMPPWELSRYRKMARQRDELQNDMLALEQDLDLDDAEADNPEPGEEPT